MKKILKGMMILSICLMASITKVGATANKGGGIAGGGVGGDCAIKGMCNYNNSNFLALRAIFAYVDNGTIKESYHPYYFVIDNGNYLKNNVGISSAYIYTATQWGAEDIDLSSQTRYKQASYALRDFFDDKKESLNNDKEINANLKKFIKKSVNTKKKYADYSWKQVREKVLMKKESQLANKTESKAATKGWRILIEPVFNYTYTGSEPRLWTVKEYAQYFGVTNKNTKLKINNITKTGTQWVNIQDVRPITGSDKAQSQYLFTTFKDVGIVSPKQNGAWNDRRSVCAKISLDKLGADMEEGTKIKHGCGLNIYDVGYESATTCYDVGTDYDSVTCEKNDDYNIGTYSTSIEKVTCKAGEALYKKNHTTGTLSQYGTLVAEDSGCKLYVKENGQVKLPGGVTKTSTLGKDITDGGYFAWPARYNASKGLKLEMKASFLFRRIGKDKCTTAVLTRLYKKGYDYATKDLKFEAKLTAGNNLALSNSPLVVGNKKETIYREAGFKNRDNVTFRVTTVAYLQINQNKNRLQNKGTGVVKDYNAADAKSNSFVDRGEGVISLKKNSGTKGYLKLTDIKIGRNGGYKINNYSCPYNIKSATCVCPPDTYRAGENLTDKWKAVNETCEQLQKKVCNEPDYCVRDGKQINITDCIKAYKKKGKTHNDAKALCTKEKCEKRTCSNTNYEIPEKDWNSCVNSGKTETDCEEELCTKKCYYMNKESGKVEERDISGCVANGFDEATCTQSICQSPCEGCKPLCDNWTESTNSSGDINLAGSGKDNYGQTMTCSIGVNSCYKKCVKEKLGLKESDSISTLLNNSDGKSEGDVKEAITACTKETTCENTFKANKLFDNVMFRTIDKQHPFPGTSGTDSRQPGSNWSVESDVNNYIKNARGAEGEALYNKTPLYTIELTPALTREIREYNKEHAYTDYSGISCKGDNETACISEFLHNSQYVKLIANRSVQNCTGLSKSSTAEDFNKCYNENN